MNIPPIAIYYRTILYKIACYNPDLLPATICDAYENYVITFTNPSDSTKLLLLPYDDHKNHHSMNKYEPYRGRVKIWYCCRKHNEIYATKRQECIAPSDLIKTRNIFNCHWFSRINSDASTFFMEYQHYMDQTFIWLLRLYPLNPLLYLLNWFLWLFSSCSIEHPLFKYLCLLWFKFLSCFVCVDFLNACDGSPLRQIFCTYHFHFYNRLFKYGHDLM